MTLTETVRAAWGWCGVDAVEVVGENDFGNLMVKDSAGRYWRLCPEDLSCTVVARDREELEVVSRSQEFLRDWYMSGLVEKAFQRFGALPEGLKYCLKIPGVLGGEYGGDNLATIHLDELIRASGDIAQQIKDLPEGEKVRFKIVDDAVNMSVHRNAYGGR